MPFLLKIADVFSQQGWRVKIRDKEKVEDPHVHILRKTFDYRLNLRTGEFMDREPNPKDVPKQLKKDIWEQRSRLIAEWNKMYPEMGVSLEAETHDD
jgi:hypothetical protein